MFQVSVALYGGTELSWVVGDEETLRVQLRELQEAFYRVRTLPKEETLTQSFQSTQDPTVTITAFDMRAVIGWSCRQIKGDAAAMKYAVAVERLAGVLEKAAKHEEAGDQWKEPPSSA